MNKFQNYSKEVQLSIIKFNEILSKKQHSSFHICSEEEFKISREEFKQEAIKLKKLI